MIEFKVVGRSRLDTLRGKAAIYARGMMMAFEMCWQHLVIAPVIAYVLHHTLGFDSYVAISFGVFVSMIAVMVTLGAAAHVAVHTTHSSQEDAQRSRRMAAMFVKDVKQRVGHIDGVSEAMTSGSRELSAIWELADKMELKGCGDPTCTSCSSSLDPAQFSQNIQ